MGSLPGEDPFEAARAVVGELPDLPHLPELPGRGVGADIIGRGAGLLVDIAVELVPSGYRVTARPGRGHRRAVDLLRTDLDALEAAVEGAGSHPPVVKVQAAGPWTLAASVELHSGHRVITDSGALREFAASLGEGLRVHADELSRRLGTRVLVQLDEPSLPDVLAGGIPTPSGYGTVAAVAVARNSARSPVRAAARPPRRRCRSRTGWGSRRRGRRATRARPAAPAPGSPADGTAQRRAPAGPHRARRRTRGAHRSR